MVFWRLIKSGLFIRKIFRQFDSVTKWSKNSLIKKFDGDSTCWDRIMEAVSKVSLDHYKSVKPWKTILKYHWVQHYSSLALLALELITKFTFVCWSKLSSMSAHLFTKSFNSVLKSLVSITSLVAAAQVESAPRLSWARARTAPKMASARVSTAKLRLLLRPRAGALLN